jgi:hypothetical protein
MENSDILICKNDTLTIMQNGSYFNFYQQVIIYQLRNLQHGGYGFNIFKKFAMCFSNFFPFCNICYKHPGKHYIG